MENEQGFSMFTFIKNKLEKKLIMKLEQVIQMFNQKKFTL
jgi:hypothetical protein